MRRGAEPGTAGASRGAGPARESSTPPIRIVDELCINLAGFGTAQYAGFSLIDKSRRYDLSSNGVSSRALYLCLDRNALGRARHFIRHDEVIGAWSGQLVIERRLRPAKRLPRRVRDCRRVGVPKNVLVVGEQKDLDVPAKSADPLGRANELAFLIGLRKLERVLKCIARGDARAFGVGDLDVDQRSGLGRSRWDRGDRGRKRTDRRRRLGNRRRTVVGGRYLFMLWRGRGAYRLGRALNQKARNHVGGDEPDRHADACLGVAGVGAGRRVERDVPPTLRALLGTRLHRLAAEIAIFFHFVRSCTVFSGTSEWHRHNARNSWRGCSPTG